MAKRILIACILALTCSLFAASPASAGGDHDGDHGAHGWDGGWIINHGRSEVYEEGPYDNPYSFDDDSCGFTFHVEGRDRGYARTRVVPGSDGQAFFAESWYRWRETLTNPENGKKMYLSGRGFFREVAARHVEGTIWDFVSIDRGEPFTMRDARGKVIVADRGKLVRKQRFDTLGDGVPGGEPAGEEIVLWKFTRGHFPSFAPGFDFCAIVAEELDAEPVPATP